MVPDWERFIEAVQRPEPEVFRIRTGRITEDELLERLRLRGFRTRPVDGLPAFHRVERGPHPVSLTAEHWHGLLYVQQASTGVAPPVLGVGPGARVLDLCAAPGGKTTHLAELMGDEGCLVANEISESRIRGLLGNVYRLAHPNVFAVAGDGRELPEGPLFDHVLVDAPCSGEGTLRRRGGRPPDQSASFVSYVTRAQKELLDKAIRLVRPGGTVLYVTCTFAPEENEGVLSELLAHAPVELEPLDLPVRHAPGLTAFDGTSFDPRVEGAARIYPHHLDSGGLFLAKLRRVGSASGTWERDDAGWSRVPAVFPGDEPSGEDGAGRVAAALADVAERFGVDHDVLDGFDWHWRGGRLWAHRAREWPLPGWRGDAWRPVSLGLRAVELDTRGRARPTNDFLRAISPSIRKGVLDLDRGALDRLLEGGRVALDGAAPGPVALRFDGDVLGRGVAYPDGVESEIPKARRADLRRALDARGQKS